MALEHPNEPHTPTRSADATIGGDYFQYHERFLAGEGQAVSDRASKYIGTALHIAGLIHAVEMQPEGSPIITEVTLVQAISIGQYFLQHSLYAYSMVGTDLSIQKARFVWAKLCKKEIAHIKRTELFQMCREKFFKKTDELLPALELLADCGYIRIEEPKHSFVGIPPDTQIIVPPDAC